VTSIYFDRRVHPDLVDVLAPGGPLHGLSTIAADPISPVDLRLRANPGNAVSRATFYVNLTKVLDVEHHPTKGFRFKPTPGKNVPSAFQPDWKKWGLAGELQGIVGPVVAYVPLAIAALAAKFDKTSGEGQLQTRLAKTPPSGVVTIDREAVPGFATAAQKTAVLAQREGPIAEAVTKLDGGVFGKLKSLGSEADLLAIDGKGRLLVIEVKGATNTAGIRWSPAQVLMYASLFQLWREECGDSHATEVLGGMIAQHRRILGLEVSAPPVGLAEIVPVVAIEATPSKTALVHLRKVQENLLAARVGSPSLEVWLVAANRSVTMWPWAEGVGAAGSVGSGG
jgi:hypothetical protein